MVEYEQRGFADQLNIQTPEQVDLRFPVAGIGSRFVALLVDHLLQLAVYILEIIVLVMIGRNAPDSSRHMGEMDAAGKWAMAVLIFFNFLLMWGYFSLFEALWHGQTPGKRLMKLRVIKDSGRQITLFEALARNLLRVVDSLPGFYLAGVIAMLCNRKNKRLGDMAAGTLVVHEVGEMQPLLVGNVAGQDSNFFARPGAAPQEYGLPADAVARLDVADLTVVETFFARALDLDIQTREAMAWRIAQKMSAKMGLLPPAGNPERLLEALVRAMRGSGRRF